MLLNSRVFRSLTHFRKVSDNPLSLKVPLMAAPSHIVSNYRAADCAWPQGWHCAKSTAGIGSGSPGGNKNIRLAMCKLHKALSQTENIYINQRMDN